MKNIMFGDKKKKLTDSERSLISETVSIEEQSIAQEL